MSKKGTIKEQVASLCTDITWIKDQIGNHLKHHWSFNMVLLGAIVVEALGLIGAAITYIFTSLR